MFLMKALFDMVPEMDRRAGEIGAEFAGEGREVRHCGYPFLRTLP